MKKNEIHILVVDDDESIRKLLSQTIEKAGFKVTVAATPAEAENIIKIKPVQIAIVDCMLPVINGIDFSKKILSAQSKNTQVILISGVFRDEQFAADAIKKSGAATFFQKPLDLGVLLEKVSELASPLLDAKSGSLESLLTKIEITKRESRKTIDFLENISGYDLMLVLGVLMKAKSTGYVNVTDQKKRLTGFTLVDGDLIDVDTLKTTENLQALLIEKGLITETDFRAVIARASKRDPLGYMVAENYISPHMERIIKIDKIIDDLKRLFEQPTIDVNFIESKDLAKSEVAINQQVLEGIFCETVIYSTPLHWFKNFYAEWKDKVIVKADGFRKNAALQHLGVGETTRKIIDAIDQSQVSIVELAAKSNEKDTYSTIHYLVVARLICFANETKRMNVEDQAGRLAELFSKIQGKSPFEVFSYFGAADNSPPLEIERIYKEFAKGNHPDKMAKSSAKELVDLNHKVFAIVSEAYSILISPEKRTEYMNKMKQEDAKNQIRAEEKMEKAVPLLERAKYQEAYELMSEAHALHSKQLSLRLYYYWAKIKVEPAKVKTELGKLNQEFNDVSTEEKSALFYFVTGLLSTLEADFVKAERLYNRSLELNKNFLAARRELGALKSMGNKDKAVKSKTTDFLNGDITTIVSGLFKKKSG